MFKVQAAWLYFKKLLRVQRKKKKKKKKRLKKRKLLSFVISFLETREKLKMISTLLLNNFIAYSSSKKKIKEKRFLTFIWTWSIETKMTFTNEDVHAYGFTSIYLDEIKRVSVTLSVFVLHYARPSCVRKSMKYGSVESRH